jgi:hypothetical protein
MTRAFGFGRADGHWSTISRFVSSPFVHTRRSPLVSLHQTPTHRADGDMQCRHTKPVRYLTCADVNARGGVRGVHVGKGPTAILILQHHGLRSPLSIRELFDLRARARTGYPTLVPNASPCYDEALTDYVISLYSLPSAMFLSSRAMGDGKRFW